MEKIEKLARDFGLKKSDIIRMAIKKFIETTSGPERKPYEKAVHLIGVAESGIHDLGQSHRKYLIDKIKAEDCAISLNFSKTPPSFKYFEKSTIPVTPSSNVTSILYSPL